MVVYLVQVYTLRVYTYVLTIYLICLWCLLIIKARIVSAFKIRSNWGK